MLPNWTDSLLSTADGAQNLPRDKALFYVFHVAPEWLVEALLLSGNARRTFRTGMWGDAAANKPMPDVDKYIPFVRKASTN